MRALVVVLALAACNDHGSSPPIQCFNMECSGAELCLVQGSGIDAGVGSPPQCVAIPKGCPVSDCSGATCPMCILDLCTDGSLDAFVRLQRRTLSCPAQ